VRDALTQLVNNWGTGETADEDEDGEGSAKKGLSDKVRKRLLDLATWKRDGGLLEIGDQLRETLGEEVFDDHNVFLQRVEAAIRRRNVKLSAGDLKLIIAAVSWRDESAAPVIKKVHKPGKAKADPLRGLYEVRVDGKAAVVEYEPDSELRDFEQIPLLEEGGIEAFIRREVLPYTPDAWIVDADTKIGYEVSFTRHFYQPPQLRTLAQISADILALEQETEGLLNEITKGAIA
jgi:type I restriction enzyme M protein